MTTDDTTTERRIVTDQATQPARIDAHGRTAPDPTMDTPTEVSGAPEAAELVAAAKAAEVRRLIGERDTARDDAERWADADEAATRALPREPELGRLTLPDAIRELTRQRDEARTEVSLLHQELHIEREHRRVREAELQAMLDDLTDEATGGE